MTKIVVLVSGGGTNLQAIMDKMDSGAITNAEIVAVISNKADAYVSTLNPTSSPFSCCWCSGLWDAC